MLDPVVAEAMKQTLEQINTHMMHPNDYERWMCLFPALIAAGYTWDPDDVYHWVVRHWPKGLGSGVRNRRAAQISAWARMALAQSSDLSDWADWAEHTVNRAKRSNAARKAWATRRQARRSSRPR